MKDKLDIFFNLLKQKEKDAYYRDIYEDMLRNISSNRDAFLFLYESMPLDVKPDLVECSQYFRETFLSVIEKEDEKTFNSYFFSGMHECFDLETIRKLHFKLPTNEKLKEYFKGKDNPKNIDEIVSSLSLLWQNNSEHFSDMFKKYKPKLEKLSKITREKSRAAEYFCYWGRKIINKHGFDYFLDFCKGIKLEPICFCLNTNQNLGYDIVKMTPQEVEFFINYGNNFTDLKNPRFKYSFRAIEAVCNYTELFHSLVKISENHTPENLKKFSIIWDTQQDYLKEVFGNFLHDRNYQDSTVDFLAQRILNESFDRKNDYSHNVKYYKKDFERVLSWGKVATLEVELHKNDEPQQKRVSKL